MTENSEIKYRIVHNENPVDLCINLDTYPAGGGITNLKITVNGKIHIFSVDDLSKLFDEFKNILDKSSN